MHEAFEGAGQSALVAEIRAYVRRNQTNGEIYRKFYELASGSNEILSFYMQRIPHQLVASLLGGDVTYQYHRDIRFEAMCATYAQTDNLPCTYLIVCARVKFGAEVMSGSQVREKSPYAGCGPSVHQYAEVALAVKRYISFEDPDTQEEAEEIEQAFVKEHKRVFNEDLSQSPKEKKQCLGGRRYLPSERSILMLDLFYYRVMSMIVRPAKKEMTADELNQPLSWVPQEVGWASKGASRSDQHRIHSGSNYVFGKLHVVGDPHHAGFVEMLDTILAGSLCLDHTTTIGLNPSLPGNVPLRGRNALDRPSLDGNWALAQEYLVNNPLIRKMVASNEKIDRQKRERLRQAVNSKQDLPAATLEVERLEAEAESDDEVIDLLQELDAAISERAQEVEQLSALHHFTGSADVAVPSIESELSQSMMDIDDRQSASSRSPSRLASNTPMRGDTEPIAEDGAERAPEDPNPAVAQLEPSAEADTADSESDEDCIVAW